MVGHERSFEVSDRAGECSVVEILPKTSGCSFAVRHGRLGAWWVGINI